MLNLIYQDKLQIENNCFIHQLNKTLFSYYKKINLISLNQLKSFSFRKPKKNEKTLILLKLRDWINNIPFIAGSFNETKIYFYDQDPWEAYHDNCVARNAYKYVFSMINVEKFLVTSSWWSKFIQKKDNLPVSFVRMGILPSLCNEGPSISERKYEFGFQGALHKHRNDFFKRLEKKKIFVHYLSRVKFNDFLKTVQNIKVFVYNENSAISINGKKKSINGLWGKCLTVAGRGCFVLRNYDESADAYGINELPSVFTFTNEKEIPNIIEKIKSLSSIEMDSLRSQTVKTLIKRNDWLSIIKEIES